LVQAVGWVGFVGGGLVTPRLAAKAAARVWCKLPGNPGRRKDNRPWPGQLSRFRHESGSDLVIETWEPHSHPPAEQPAPNKSPDDFLGEAPTATDLDDAATPSPAAQVSPPAEPAPNKSPDDFLGGASSHPADGPEPKTVLLVHGWGGWRGQVAAFVAPLTRDGFRVIAFDALSHGDSGPGEHGASHSSGGELTRSLEAVASGIGQPYGVIAHSLGCAAVCRAYLGGTVTFEKLTLVSPSPDMRQVAASFARKLGFRKRATRMLTEEMEKRAHGKLAEFDIADMGATGALPDALVIHDAADKESPYRVSQDIAERWTGARLMTTEGLGHHRILIKPAVVEAAAANMLD
jgi:pimeloyl-ACP methyl ester carboxylesterase